MGVNKDGKTSCKSWANTNGYCASHQHQAAIKEEALKGNVYDFFVNGPLKAMRQSIKSMSLSAEGYDLQQAELGQEMELARTFLMEEVSQDEINPVAVRKWVDLIRSLSTSMTDLERVRGDRSGVSLQELNEAVTSFMGLAMGIFLVANREDKANVREAYFSKMITDLPDRLELDRAFGPPVAPLARLYAFTDNFPDKAGALDVKSSRVSE